MSNARAPPSCMRPSGPRTTDGKSGSDSRAFMCAEGMRSMAVAESVLPSVVDAGDEDSDRGATTVVVSVERAIESVMRSAASRETRTESNPGSDTINISPVIAGSMTNEPSGLVRTVATTSDPEST